MDNSFTNQKPRIATRKDLKATWGGCPNGERFRCYLCGYKFKIGDYWRWVYSQRYLNFLVCKKCDHSEVNKTWNDRNLELRNKFWWYVQDYRRANTFFEK